MFAGSGLNLGAEKTYNAVIKGTGLLSASVSGSYCKVYKDLKCDSNLLAAMQWTYQGVTYDTPEILG